MKHPGDPPEGLPCLPASAVKGPAPFDYDALMKFVNDTEREERLTIPCYSCGEKSGMLCGGCRHVYCFDCYELGDHNYNRCDFMSVEESPD